MTASTATQIGKTRWMIFRNKLVDRLGGHLRIRIQATTQLPGLYADYDNTIHRSLSLAVTFLNYTENADASEIATRVIPIGKRLEESSIEGLEEYTTIKSVNNSVPYIESTDAVKVYGVVTRTVSFEDVGEPANLKKKAEKYLSDIQFENLSLTCNAVDLNMVDVDIERIKLGDSIRVVSKPHGMDRYFPVTALTIDLQNPQNNTVTLGTSVKAGISERTTNQNDSLVQKIQSLPPQSDTLRMAIENATALITAATTGHVVTRPEEILIMDTADKDTAKKVWRWNLNGLGYSSTGYNGTFGTAITMDGKIVGKYIAARSIYADSFIAGELQTAWNGITDYIQLKNGELQVFNTSDQLVSKSIIMGSIFTGTGTYVGKIGTTSGQAMQHTKGWCLIWNIPESIWHGVIRKQAEHHPIPRCCVFHREIVSTRNRDCIWDVIFMGNGIHSTTLNFRVFLLADTVHLLERSQSS